MKRVIILMFLFFCLPVFANNSLQTQYEKSFNVTAVPNVLYMINEDFGAYYNNGRSFYGYILYAIEECSVKNKKVDLLYLEKIKLSWENAYSKQSLSNLKFLTVPDKDYIALEPETKFYIKTYNDILKFSEQ